MGNQQTTKLRCIAYAAGPGDIVNTFSYWQKGHDDPNQLSVTYSAQFFDACRNLGLRGVAISSCPRADVVKTGQFHVENLPKRPPATTVSFHTEQVMYVRKVIGKALAEKADMLIMADATGYYFATMLFAPPRLKIVPTVHCNLWSRFLPLSPVQSAVKTLNAHFFTRRAAAVLSVSPSINEQIASMGTVRNRPVHRFYQLYRRHLFDSIRPPELRQDKFNILFAGRLEEEKGVFDLLELGEKLNLQKECRITMHICGTGSMESALRKKVAEKGLRERCFMHGFCTQQQLMAHIEASHAFIIPTKTTFEEGYNKSLVEALLSGRPAVTSSVCVYPWLETLSDGIVEVPPGDIDAYLHAVTRLARDNVFYTARQSACQKGMERFLDPAWSWQASFEQIITELENE